MGLPLLALLDDLGPAMLAVDYLENSAFDLQACNSLGELWSAARRTPGSVALVDWRRIEGLLNDEHQHFLAQVDQAAPLVLLFDDTFGQPRARRRPGCYSGARLADSAVRTCSTVLGQAVEHSPRGPPGGVL